MKNNFAKATEAKLNDAQGAGGDDSNFFTQGICQHGLSKPIHLN